MTAPRWRPPSMPKSILPAHLRGFRYRRCAAVGWSPATKSLASNASRKANLAQLVSSGFYSAVASASSSAACLRSGRTHMGTASRQSDPIPALCEWPSNGFALRNSNITPALRSRAPCAASVGVSLLLATIVSNISLAPSRGSPRNWTTFQREHQSAATEEGQQTGIGQVSSKISRMASTSAAFAQISAIA